VRFAQYARGIGTCACCFAIVTPSTTWRYNNNNNNNNNNDYYNVLYGDLLMKIPCLKQSRQLMTPHGSIGPGFDVI
jgi:acetone carboxylase gamma subunit